MSFLLTPLREAWGLVKRHKKKVALLALAGGGYYAYKKAQPMLATLRAALQILNMEQDNKAMNSGDFQFLQQRHNHNMRIGDRTLCTLAGQIKSTVAALYDPTVILKQIKTMQQDQSPSDKRAATAATLRKLVVAGFCRVLVTTHTVAMLSVLLHLQISITGRYATVTECERPVVQPGPGPESKRTVPNPRSELFPKSLSVLSKVDPQFSHVVQGVFMKLGDHFLHQGIPALAAIVQTCVERVLEDVVMERDADVQQVCDWLSEMNAAVERALAAPVGHNNDVVDNYSDGNGGKRVDVGYLSDVEESDSECELQDAVPGSDNTASVDPESKTEPGAQPFPAASDTYLSLLFPAPDQLALSTTEVVKACVSLAWKLSEPARTRLERASRDNNQGDSSTTGQASGREGKEGATAVGRTDGTEGKGSPDGQEDDGTSDAHDHLLPNVKLQALRIRAQAQGRACGLTLSTMLQELWTAVDSRAARCVVLEFTRDSLAQAKLCVRTQYAATAKRTASTSTQSSAEGKEREDDTPVLTVGHASAYLKRAFGELIRGERTDHSPSLRAVLVEPVLAHFDTSHLAGGDPLQALFGLGGGPGASRPPPPQAVLDAPTTLLSDLCSVVFFPADMILRQGVPSVAVSRDAPAAPGDADALSSFLPPDLLAELDRMHQQGQAGGPAGQ